MEDDTVLDPMMGSDTTWISALKLGRKFVGINIDEKNFLTSKSRLHQHFLEVSSRASTRYKDLEYSGMTESCLVDCLKQNLATITGRITASDTEKISDIRKYYNQANNLLKIGAFRPATQAKCRVVKGIPRITPPNTGQKFIGDMHQISAMY